jgi:8-oxo-dGTP pyrophosphatase MutT (NUDIX family)
MDAKKNESASFLRFGEGILDDPQRLCSIVQSALKDCALRENIYPPGAQRGPESSAVLFPLGLFKTEDKALASLILNKRSLMVKQPGDLCFPGGGVMPRIDTIISKVMALPMMPLGRWPLWGDLIKKRPNQAARLSTLFATGVREGLEEMGINPFRLRFLGPLPPQDLVMYRRTIYPLAAWLDGQSRFRTNWEVDKVVFIPLRDLMTEGLYRRCRMVIRGNPMEFPCFLHRDDTGEDIIWGATYRIVVEFLTHVFGFTPPPTGDLQLLETPPARPYLNTY